jgi:hypothetical protein
MDIIKIASDLLYKGESPTLDYKQAQYKFAGATDREKSELLKDILAFANAWRNEPAYIFIGAKDGKGEKAEVVGISKESHIDDAVLQQFVNEKTNKPIIFSYLPFEMEGKNAALIYIPVQERPFYLNKDFGRNNQSEEYALKKTHVYIRRGSSTGIAEPDEIAKMGVKTFSTPKLLPLVSLERSRDSFLRELVIETENAIVPSKKKIPDYSEATKDGSLSSIFDAAHINRDFYRELAAYIRDSCFYKQIYFSVENYGDITANDVNMVLSFSGAYIEISSSPFLRKPKTHTYLSDHLNRNVLDPSMRDLTVEERKDGVDLRFHLGKIQAKDMGVTCNTLRIGARISNRLIVGVRVYSDELPTPIADELILNFEVSQKTYSHEDLNIPAFLDIGKLLKKP